MKVTVCFGSIRVLVPCGAGDLLVRDLVREATLRYKKATGQGPETWVGVRALRANSGGILDPDDRVCDVADDRETLTAECAAPAPARAAQADGASGSSAGTASPDMFRGGGGVGGSMRVPNRDSCVEVGEADLEDGANGLQVRRGSEPTLHQDNIPQQRPLTDQTKRWSAAVVCRDEVRFPPKLPPDPPPDRLHANHFQRQSNRLSMQFSGPGSGNWLDAAERISTYGSKSLPRDARREPLGQEPPPPADDTLRWLSGVNGHSPERPLDLVPEVSVGSRERAISGMEVPVSANSKPASGAAQVAVTLVKGEKGLGFTITTRDNPTGGHCPIYIKNILPKGAAVSDGRLRAGDRLVSVNGISVSGLSQTQVVTLLRNTPTDCSVDIVVERPVSGVQRIEQQLSPSKYTEKAIGTPNSLSKSLDLPKAKENGRVSSIVNAINNSANSSMRAKLSKSSSKDDLINGQSAESALQEALNSSSNSVLGLRNRLILRLDVPVHDSEKAGLGISVKGKVTVGPQPQDLGIFIKSVLHGGAASRDGRLHTNDQLVSVNGVSLVGQPNAAAMEALRRALLHAPSNTRGNISLTIARRTDSMDSLARWKDDTPPNGNESSNTNNSTENNSQNFANTVIYNHGDKENKIDGNYNKDRSYDEIANKRNASIVTINNNSWVSNQSDDNKGFNNNKESDPKRDSFEWSRLDGWNPVIDRLTGLRNESYYMATQDAHAPNAHAHAHTNNAHAHANGYRSHVHVQRPSPAHNVIIEEDYGTTRGSASGTVESCSSLEAEAFSRDAVGRRSMSEKRHAAMDAKATGTYKKLKQHKQVTALQVGPSLGMRKSSSLESLQTAIQETQRNPRSEPIYARAHPPLKHWLTDDSHGPEIVRGSPQQSSLSHKKNSLLKSLTTMFRIGSKPQKKPETELYGRTQPGRSSEKSISREALERLRIEDREQRAAPQQTQRANIAVSHSRQASGERSDKSEERRHAPHRAVPMRTGPQTMEGAWGPSGHYVNYDEIQQNLNLRREKLSEVQLGQMRRQVNAQRAKAEEESRRVGAGYQSQRSCREAPAPRPQSNYYEYETAPPRRPGKLSHYH